MHGFYAVDGPASRRKCIFIPRSSGASRWTTWDHFNELDQKGLAVECDPSRIKSRLWTRYLDAKVATIDQALVLIGQWTRAGEAKSVGLLGNAAEVLPELLRRGVRPDMVTDQTSAHDPIHGYLPAGWTQAEWAQKRQSDPKAVERAACDSIRQHVQAMLGFWNQGIPTFDSGSVASPNRETEAMRDGSDAVSDWPLLNALLNTATGATGCRCIMAEALEWVSHSIRAW